MWIDTEIDLGLIERGREYYVVFTHLDVSNEGLIDFQAATTCGCTDASWNTKTLELTVTVKLKSLSKFALLNINPESRITKQIHIQYKDIDGNHFRDILTIKATVKNKEA